jgi:hypothetical protein
MSRLLCWAVPDVPKILAVGQSMWLLLKEKRKNSRGATPPLLINSSTNKYPPFHVPDRMNIQDKTKYSPIG